MLQVVNFCGHQNCWRFSTFSLQTYTLVHPHTHTPPHLYSYTLTHLHTYTLVHPHTYTLTRLHTYIPTHLYTHTPTCLACTRYIPIRDTPTHLHSAYIHGTRPMHKHTYTLTYTPTHQHGTQLHGTHLRTYTFTYTSAHLHTYIPTILDTEYLQTCTLTQLQI